MSGRGLLVRLRALFQRRAAEAELDEELRYHLERDAELGRARGFGNVGVIKEEVRDSWSWSWLEQLLQDLRYGARALRRSPAFTIVAVASLGIGIGANTAVFGLINGIMLRPLAVPHPERMFALQRNTANDNDQSFSWAELQALRAAAPALGLSGSRGTDNTPIAIGQAEDYSNIDVVDGAYYATLGVQALYGRLISADDVARGAPVAVVSERFAARNFGAAPAAVGRSLTIRGQPFEVIGVLPSSFAGLEYPGYFELAIPLTTTPLIGEPDYRAESRSRFGVVGRLADPRSWDATRSALDAALRRCCAAAVPEHLTLLDMTHGIGGGKDDVRGAFRPALLALMASVVVVLLIACANVGNLLLLRAAAREREIAVRLSLGSSRRRLIRQLVTESLMLGMLGMLAGLGLAAWTTSLLVKAMPDFGTRYADMVRFTPSPEILGFTLASGLGAVLLFGLVPAFASTRRDVAESLKAGARTATRRQKGLLGRGMVAVQVALALVLVSSASLLVSTLRNLSTQTMGVATQHIVGLGVETRGTRLEAAGIVPWHAEILRRVRAAPGVGAAGMATIAPFFGGRYSTLRIRHADGTMSPPAMMSGITPGYLEVDSIRLLAGRSVLESDAAGTEPVALVSAGLARQEFGAADPIGRILDLDNEGSSERVRIIGVTSDIVQKSPRDGATPVLYRPLGQIGHWPYVELLVRTRDGGDALTQAVIDTVRAATPGVRVRNVSSAAEQVRAWLLRELLVAWLASAFGALALGLAAIGIYGVIAYNVARRTSEIGVRMALGATARDVLSLILGGSFALTAAGILIGAPLVYVAGRALASMLYGVGAHDPLMLALSVAILGAATACAALLPALRAMRIDPLVALRSE